MTVVGVFVVATKLAGLLVTVSIATNAFAYSKFRKKNLSPFKSPIDESADVLADFNSFGEDDNSFFFGLATAPAHVEDKLDDADALLASATPDGVSQQASVSSDESDDASLLKTTMGRKRKAIKLAMEAMIRGIEKYSPINGADEDSSYDGSVEECSHNIAAWQNVPRPEERLRFWSNPDVELKLARDSGVSVFRMGIDWTRIMHKEPKMGIQEAVNYAALERYRWIVERVRSYGMKVMITLFHHSLPRWAGEYGGWKMERTVDYFMDFTRLVVDRISDLVDYWVTFNEPHVFCMLTYCAGAWPGGQPDMLEVATSALPIGVFNQAMHWISVAHMKAYDYIHGLSGKISEPTIGIAQHVSFMRPYGLFDVAAVRQASSLTVFPFVDSVCEKLDFVGINYYGQEVVSGPGLKLVDGSEYSESGRGVYPDGLYRALLQFHERYKHLNMPFIVTENGVSDATDLIRCPYILEHLLAISAAVKMGVPVIGYLFWTTSDNWEWADGYGPKFGLVEVDRANGLKRTPRPSYYLFCEVVKSGKITKLDRKLAWNELQRAVKERKTRPFCRAVDKSGLMYAGGLDVPTYRPYAQKDWRFGHYEMEGLQDPLSRLLRFTLKMFSHKKDQKQQPMLRIFSGSSIISSE